MADAGPGDALAEIAIFPAGKSRIFFVQARIAAHPSLLENADLSSLHTPPVNFHLPFCISVTISGPSTTLYRPTFTRSSAIVDLHSRSCPANP